jgi:MOSC domain-containing protein YiiM
VDGRVEGIFLTDTHGALPEPVESVRALAGRGLEGGRYFDDPDPGRNLTLIAAEALEAFERETGVSLSAAESRRNVLTRVLVVYSLVGYRFRIGDVDCVGVELCEPCAHLQSMTKPGVLAGMVHRAGLNVDILADGEIAVGDPVTAEG